LAIYGVSRETFSPIPDLKIRFKMFRVKHFRLSQTPKICFKVFHAKHQNWLKIEKWLKILIFWKINFWNGNNVSQVLWNIILRRNRPGRKQHKNWE